MPNAIRRAETKIMNSMPTDDEIKSKAIKIKRGIEDVKIDGKRELENACRSVKRAYEDMLNIITSS